MKGRRHRSGWWIALLACSSVQAGKAGEPARATDDDLRIRGIFESALPGTERKSSIRAIVHPHFGDLHEREYLRTALGLRAGLTANWEATVEADWFLAHGLKTISFLSESGFSSVHVGSKYRLGELGASGWDCSVGADFVRPIGSPPASLTDGLQHVAPYVTISRTLARWPDWRVFYGGGYDFVTNTSIVGQLTKNQLTDDSSTLSGGFLWSRGALTYTFEASYGTMHFTKDSSRDFVTVRPGFVWVLPSRYTFGSRGKWLFGFALRASRGVDGIDLGASAKLRASFDLRRLVFGARADSPVSR